MSSIRRETVSGVKWQLLQKLTLEPVQLAYGMVLARFVGPEEMGILGLTAVFFALASSLADAGFGQALIRKIDRTETDINTMFWFNLGMSFLVCLALFLAAPWFAAFYHQPALVWLTRISAVMMFLNSTAGVHWTLYTCRRDFKTPAIVRSAATLVGMPVCLVLAWQGFSYWAIVIQGVVVGLLNLTVVWKISPWKPRFVFSGRSFRDLFGFGSKLALSGVLWVFYNHLRTFIIGKFYTPADLGLYSRGGHLAGVVPNTLGGMLESVSYPVMSTIQNDDVRLREVYRKYIKVSTMVICWAVFLVAALGQPFTYVMYGEKWQGCVVYLQLFCFSCCVGHISGINLSLLKVKGRSDLILGLEFVKRIISIAMAVYAATISVEAICWASIIYTQFAIFINCHYTAKIINLSWWQQQKDYLPYVLLSGLCVLPAYGIARLPLPPLLQLFAGGMVSFALYLGCLHAMRDGAFRELLVTLGQNPKVQRIGVLRRFVEYELRRMPG